MRDVSLSKPNHIHTIPSFPSIHPPVLCSILSPFTADTLSSDDSKQFRSRTTHSESFLFLAPLLLPTPPPLPPSLRFLALLCAADPCNSCHFWMCCFRNFLTSSQCSWPEPRANMNPPTTVVPRTRSAITITYWGRAGSTGLQYYRVTTVVSD